MTVFDRLEAQLLDAHPNRARRGLPRPAPRRVVAFAAAVAAVAVVAVAALSAGSSSAPRPDAAAAPGAPLPGTMVAVLNAGAPSGSAGRIAGRLGRHGFSISIVDNAKIAQCTGTLVYFRPGRSASAFRVAQILGKVTLLPIDRTVLREAQGKLADVIVVLGKPA